MRVARFTTPSLYKCPGLSSGSSFCQGRLCLQPFLLLFWITNPITKRRNRGEQRSANFKLGYKSIDQGQRIAGSFATGKQYHLQFRSYTFHFRRNIAHVHDRRLVVEQHGVDLHVVTSISPSRANSVMVTEYPDLSRSAFFIGQDR
jgi:hypothetical protein